MKRSGAWVVSLVVFLLVAPLVFGSRSGYHLLRLKRTLWDLQNEIVTAKQSQLALKKEIDALQSNPFAQMKAIRETLGYIGPNEKMFHFVEGSHAARPR
jgi:cell division protein FtsB